jgi:hypothetical protein
MAKAELQNAGQSIQGMLFTSKAEPVLYTSLNIKAPKFVFTKHTI